jgi:hypothetical protein
LANTIKFKRGTEAQIGVAGLSHGEPAIATDTDQVFVGTAASMVSLSDSGHTHSLLDLTDTPGSYSTAGYYFVVNSGATGMEFLAPVSGRHTETFSSQTQIVVTHNLGEYPVVQVLDSSDIEIVAQITHDSTNQCTVDLSESMSGRIVCVIGGGVSAGDHSHSDYAPIHPSINTQTANYTLVLADDSKMVTMSNASDRTITVPQNSSVAFPIGTIVTISRLGDGAVTIVAGSGSTLRAPNGLKLSSKYSTAQLWKIDTNEWIVYGDVES